MNTPATTALVGLVRELRPDIAEPIAASLVTEALDTTADATLDDAWARTRSQAHPALVGSSRSLVPYAERRLREAEAAKTRPGDYPGIPEQKSFSGALEKAEADEMCDFGPRHDPFLRTGCGMSITQSPTGCGQACRAVNRQAVA